MKRESYFGKSDFITIILQRRWSLKTLFKDFIKNCFLYFLIPRPPFPWVMKAMELIYTRLQALDLSTITGNHEKKTPLKEARKGFSLLQCLWNDGRLQRRIFNGVGKLYVSLQLYCWAILWGYLWRHISYHGNAQGPQKRPLNFSFCKLSEKLIRWPTIFISLLESSLNSLTFQTVWKKFI